MNYYNIIRELVVKAYPQQLPEKHTTIAKKLYDDIKSKNDPAERERCFEQEKNKLRELATKKKTGAMMFFIKANENCEAANKLKAKNLEPHNSSVSVESDAVKLVACNSNNSASNSISLTVTDAHKVIQKRKYHAPAQKEAADAVAAAEKIVEEMRAHRMSTNDNTLKTAIKCRDKAKKVLQLKEKNAIRQQRFRGTRKRTLEELCEKDENVRKKLKLNEAPGRPNATTVQTGLIEAIIDISLRGSAAHERRREDTLKSCRTLDELTKELRLQGFNLSRSGVYLRLIPRNWLTSEGKKHITTANVKLARAQNDEHRQHADTAFTKATYDYLMELASILGSYDVACLSQDDKAKVPLGLPAANKQSTILMNMEYRVKLPDHDFVVASGHKLIPSVIAGLTIESGINLKSAVTTSGPTYIGIRSGKHDSSVAATHASDLRHLYADVQQFRDVLYRQDGTVKPVLILLVDGGPDENPRYKETIKFACDNFRKLQLDALFISTNAPGRSAYNPVERRMAPLSRFLAGLILPHETFGCHLNSQGETVDEELEKRNFQQAGQALAEVWSEAVIDNYPVISEWRGGMLADQPEHETTQEWMAKHVRASQYFLQIVKCSNEECCAPPRSALRTVLPEGYFPHPLLVNNSTGLQFSNENSGKFLSLFQRLAVSISPDGYNEINKFCIPYDLCCPTVKDYVNSRTCNVCKLYFPSQVMVAAHKKQVHPRVKVNDVPLVRPVRIAARRQRELMAIIATGKHIHSVAC
jgi:hypothetical protein